MGGSANKTQLRVPLIEQIAVWGQRALADSGRYLWPEETKLLISIFGQSINLDVVQIAVTDLGTKGRPYTLGNTIRVPRGTTLDAATLVHETTHIWQYQTRGTGYLSDSIYHQLTQGATAAYNVELVAGKSFYDYPAEQEAMIVQKYYEDDPVGWKLEPSVLRMMTEVRSARPLTAAAIQQETWYGPNTNVPHGDPTGDHDLSPTVPLFRIEFP